MNTKTAKETKKDASICIIKGCKSKRHTRGLCKKCYDAAYRSVQREEVTFQKLQKSGLILKPAKRGPSKKSLFLRALKEQVTK